MMLTAQVSAGPNPSWRSPPLPGVLILCQSYCGDCACPFDEVVVPDGDGMSSSTQVFVVRHVWVPAATSQCVRHLMLPLLEALAPISSTRYQKPPCEADGCLSISD
jgi:hypothetical protein